MKANIVTWACYGIVVGLGFFSLVGGAAAQSVTLDFENLPIAGVPVEAFEAGGTVFPGSGVHLNGSSLWTGTQLGIANQFFLNIRDAVLKTGSLSGGQGPLWITFDSPVQDVSMDLSGALLSGTSTIGLSGYRNNQLVFTQDVVTLARAGGADEIRAHTSGTVDQIVVLPNAFLYLDNLSFVPVPEPATLALLMIVCAAPFCMCRRGIQ